MSTIEKRLGQPGRRTSSRLKDHPWAPVHERWRHLPEDERATGDALAKAYAEFVYFEPYVQRFLFGRPGEERKKAPIRLWRRRDVRALDVAVQNKARSRVQRFRLLVDRLNLYLFDTGNAILAVELRFDPETARAVAERSLNAGIETELRLDMVLALAERVRRIFPPYFATFDTAGDRTPNGELVAPLFPHALHWVKDDPETGKAADPKAAPAEFAPADRFDAKTSTQHLVEHACPPIHPHWRELLRPLPVEGYATDKDEIVLSQLGDDRAFSHMVLGVRDVRQIADPDWVRIAMLDEPGDGWSYAPPFLADFARQHAYDRFFAPAEDPSLTTRYVFSPYAMAQVGTCAPEGRAGWNFFRDVLVDHGRRHYFQLALIGYFQKTALLTLSERLADALARGERSFSDDAHIIQHDVLRFTHRYWFEDISAQIQGQEVFDHLRRHLRTGFLYNQVSQEVREADQFLAAEEQGRIAQGTARLNRIAGPGLVLAALTGFFGMNFFDHEKLTTAWWPWVVVLPSLLLPLLFVALYWWPSRR